MNSSTSISVPQCSVVIATYGGGDKLPTVLASLVRQTMHRDIFEVIVVDDGSDAKGAAGIHDACARFEDDLNISLVRCEKNGGPARARNRGIAAAKGDYVFFTDDDCEVPAIWMETHLRWYEKMPHVSHIGGWYFFTRKELRTSPYAQFWYTHYKATFSGIDLESFIGTSDQAFHLLVQNTANLSIHRSVLQIVPGFDEGFFVPGREDTFFAQQLKMAGFLGLFIPLHVRHTSPLTFKRFVRVIQNRGLAYYTHLRRTHWAHYSPQRYVTEWRTYKHWVRYLSASQPGIRSNRRYLLILGFLYYWGVGSGLALAIYERRWRRRSKKRDGN